ncbi:MAG: dTDP-glucose 4,6-dehydratase [Propionicimonas sp.]
MKTILITGGAGFIGSNFIHHLLREHSYRVVNLDLLTYAGNLESLADVEDDDRYAFVRGDINNRELLNLIFADYEVDAVVNFAAESYVDRSITDPDLFVRTNVMGAQTLLDVARRAWVEDPRDPRCRRYRPGVRFVQVSAAEVYGDLGAEGYFTSASPVLPRTPYAASKAGADLVAQAYHETYRLPVSIARSSVSYGPYQLPEKLIPLIIGKARAGGRVPLYGDGRQVRDWLHVHDHCAALDAVLHRGRDGATYLMGGGNAPSNAEVASLVLAQLGAGDDRLQHVDDRPGHDRRLAIDNREIFEELGWAPKLSLAEGIAQTVQWYQDNPEWLRSAASGAYREYYRLHYVGNVR